MSIATKIDLVPFCDPTVSRYALATPWRVEGFIYATDGRRIARIIDDGREFQVQEGRRPDGPGLFRDNPPPADGWGPLVPLPECKCKVGEFVEKCGHCIGGKSRCGECNGKGVATCDMGHQHDCDNCDGKGEYKCEECDGEGKETIAHECKCQSVIGGLKFNAAVLRPFYGIAGVQFSVDVRNMQMHFRAEGFQGIAMATDEA